MEFILREFISNILSDEKSYYFFDQNETFKQTIEYLLNENKEFWIDITK